MPKAVIEVVFHIHHILIVDVAKRTVLRIIKEKLGIDQYGVQFPGDNQA